MSPTTDIAVAVISSAGLTGLLGGFVAYLKDRKKDAATAKLTDVQALQQQLGFLEQVTTFLRAENERLQADYNASESARRSMRQQMSELEDRLARVQKEATQTQAQCELLSRQLRSLMANGGPNEY